MAEFCLQYEYHITSAQLIFAMLGMGVTLHRAAFLEILRFPKGFVLGLSSVLIISLARIALIIVGSSAADRIDSGAHGPAVEGGIILFSFLLFFAGFGLLELTGFPARDSVAAGIETSCRNISLAPLVKASL